MRPDLFSSNVRTSPADPLVIKETDKIYRSHSLYPGGLKERAARFIRAEKPETMIEEAVWGMLPKNKLGRKMLKKLKVYRGSNHPHQAQRPEQMTLGE